MRFGGGGPRDASFDWEGKLIQIAERTPAAREFQPMSIAFRAWFGLDGGPALVLLELYRLRSGWTTAEQLALATGSTARSVRKHHIPLLRFSLEPEAIDHDIGVGYRLTEVGEAECRRAFREIVREIEEAAA